MILRILSDLVIDATMKAIILQAAKVEGAIELVCAIAYAYYITQGG